jgi:hypothetical protein
VTYRNVSVGVWVAQATRAAMEASAAATQEMSAQFPSGHSNVNFIMDGIAAPTPDAQALMLKAMASRSDLACSLIILEGGGFWASGLRSLINNTHRDAGGSLRIRIESSLDPMLGWFCETHARHTGVVLDSGQLREALVQARQLAESTARG